MGGVKRFGTERSIDGSDRIGSVEDGVHGGRLILITDLSLAIAPRAQSRVNLARWTIHRRYRRVVVASSSSPIPDSPSRTRSPAVPPKIPRNGRELGVRIDGTNGPADEDGPITRLVNHF